ncbi:PTS lactose/cellobiose transporter subunit IIA [Avibacterium paragallinarum]|uniref:Lactose-specific phosphotransferase enzyme IIA component n=1 Tax=Avibacterium paragallinarum TaxID=728 RepID=A0A0F5EX13_AVIPA|nr:PTS lactose/cellobiose transporter subunit IIA [Avibacterium paragallinarum]AZI14841.1 PTS lactose/cellobiose transporter subunit IIA [Avibacterium paragallinarum]KAA6209670.1 PTS lactose/cellobiose transporter subunit IIA [Avibacterium paragallinarum]KKB01159.1 PTS cellobiose transporter subunit IIA [Avibacterium paragallinarum]QIR12276.1 PTS lactose/cellobiose transporter subunit IIA [Avibacterium paragallinarum]QJE08900.1 PTS lactose/cellobiose transporter subunit IIA [Avibacterium parag
MNKKISETQIMELICYAGECRSLLMQAIKKAKSFTFDEAEALIAQAEKSLLQAHSQQMALIAADEGEGELPTTIILVHAQDHIMNAVLLFDLAKELIDVYRQISHQSLNCK